MNRYLIICDYDFEFTLISAIYMSVTSGHPELRHSITVTNNCIDKGPQT